MKQKHRLSPDTHSHKKKDVNIDRWDLSRGKTISGIEREVVIFARGKATDGGEGGGIVQKKAVWLFLFGLSVHSKLASSSLQNGSMNNKLPPLLTAVGRDNGGAYYGFGNMRSGMYPSPAMAVPCGNSNSGLVSSTSRAAAAAPGAHQVCRAYSR